jgi:hypothetical protein
MLKQRISDDPNDCPTAWFAVLERARMDNDFKRAAYAESQLERLGVKVRFGPRSTARTGQGVQHARA